MTGARILFIDAYDSFSNNIISLLQQELGAATETIKIDDARFVLNDDAFLLFLQRFDAVVAGPGPGHPQTPQDIGLIARLWSLPNKALLPVLGICLGFQSFCAAHGASISRLRQPRHGLVTQVTHQSTGIFAGVQDVEATQYHSLQVVLVGMDDKTLMTDSLYWQPPSDDDLVPLAWDLTDNENGPILMAAQHPSKPFVGMQFHPESICTNREGRRLVNNWWQEVCLWRFINKPQSQAAANIPAAILSSPVIPRQGTTVEYLKVSIPKSLTVVDVTEILQDPCNQHKPIVLQSGTCEGRPLNPETGRFSILGLPDALSVHIRYTCNDQTLQTASDEGVLSSQKADIRDAFDYLRIFVDERRAIHGTSAIPFWGGLVGYLSYEAGLSSIDVSPPTSSVTRPDMWFSYIERSVVIDHIAGLAFVQSIRPNDRHWVTEVVKSIAQAGEQSCNETATAPVTASIISEPCGEPYQSKVVDCQAHLRAGSSYELCLTDQTLVQSTEDPWKIYTRLSKLNPAPFGAYFDYVDKSDNAIGIVLVGSSPERFLGWSREGKCQFRPIKGTVVKNASTSRKDAEAILRSQKEMAENLMIVDLIRHDLAGVKGVQNVRVPSLMAVEEYETVYQLVSVVEGDLAPSSSGIEVLAASLPPGSMTGAPKRRSCELLKELEDQQPRGLYSGVVGYLDVGGGGDFSVVIRTAFKWKDEDHWRVGAGGAVTILSTPKGEYEEMLVKRQRLVDVLLHENKCW